MTHSVLYKLSYMDGLSYGKVHVEDKILKAHSILCVLSNIIYIWIFLDFGEIKSVFVRIDISEKYLKNSFRGRTVDWMRIKNTFNHFLSCGAADHMKIYHKFSLLQISRISWSYDEYLQKNKNFIKKCQFFAIFIFLTENIFIQIAQNFQKMW